ncbi:sensor histidine kinase [Cesiribacter andamanensis]|uniref:histidine kinase n=1 Tax=Cesiribacter andamanensis AMV16 TaxID=1279009 RepID=M7N681_9BACT|nr:HAMP domain-containing sensor histidine kinase [Cesiribacter andamanensis]EMR02746.1 Sensor protein ZraS [Cesiribacter andamanensis AMV16]
MIFEQFEARLTLRVVLLFGVLCLSAFAVAWSQWLYLMVLLPLLAYQLTDLIRLQRKAQEELNQFVESIHYRDFSRYFDVKHAPAELQNLRQGFNEINTTFKVISKEKETQYHYLQKILELIDTGILSYKLEGGEVVWMNEALKRLLQLPYLRTIHSLEKRDAELYADVAGLQPGQSKIATASLDKNAVKILLSATAFQTDGQTYKLIAFQNVNEALDETESKAWQKLLSVMTHEIMNSIAPISSLADTLKNRLQESLVNGATTEDVEDLEVGISTIKRRSEGLLKFAETYRNLNKIITLNLQCVSLREQFANLQRLMQPTLTQKQISLEVELKEPEITLEADANLLDQVLINLLVNAIESLKGRPEPRICLAAYRASNGKVVVKISDNGSGMSREVQEKIFIPFFSTKKQGSGIGLSLCKQIVMLHKGTIQVQSVEGVGTAFFLRFG